MVDCPSCGVRKGHSCVILGSYAFKRDPHASRYEAYEQWRTQLAKSNKEVPHEIHVLTNT